MAVTLMDLDKIVSTAIVSIIERVTTADNAKQLADEAAQTAVTALLDAGYLSTQVTS